MLPTFELLDRFELLYPTNSNLSDLRRAYTDKDLSSIFRLVNDNNKEDLRKLIMEDNTWKLWPVLDSYVDTQFTAAFKSIFVNETEIWNDCFARGQLRSKLWLVHELKKCNADLGTVFLCAGWYATLATMLFESDIKVSKIKSFDVDPTCWKIAEIFNKPWVVNEWQFKASTKDIFDINFASETYTTHRSDGTTCEQDDIPDTIINTSCEHIENFAEWYAKIPDGKLVVLQGNNFFEVEEHVNCSTSISQFSRSCPMKETLFEGELFLSNYTRFMKIGYK